jgi:enediyne biosynthesis protein E4
MLKRILMVVLLVWQVTGCTQQPPEAKKDTATEPSASSDAGTKKEEASLFGDSKRKTSGDPKSVNTAPVSVPHHLRFTDVASSVGLGFTYNSGAVGQSLMVETMGGAAGALDYDHDGRVDVFICQGGNPTAAPTDATQPIDSLFRQVDDNRFVNVHGSLLLGINYRYSMGVAVADYDDDGFDDIYITNYDENQLLRNLGDGTFEDVTQFAGVSDKRWSCASAFADLNGDSLLDLYVTNYVEYDVHQPKDCRNPQGQPRMCHPRELPGVEDECFFSRGDGTFAAESKQRGLVGEDGKGLGVAIADFDKNGSMDIYVANDTTANFYFVNSGKGEFQERAKLLGCAMDRTGAYQASMGLGIGDYNRDGMLDIYSTHFYDESNTLYKNLGSAGFQDVTGIVGLHDVTLPRLGFGTTIEDFDQNGVADIFVANGHIENNADNQYHKMEPQIFTFNGRRFLDESGFSGEYFKNKVVGRGVCTADIDRDGDLDMIVVHQDSPAALLRNDSERGSWLNVEFRGRQSNRRGIGCWVKVEINGETWEQQLYAGGSYASYRQPILSFGFGAASGKAKVEVRWPSGRKENLDGVELNQLLVLVEPTEE